MSFLLEIGTEELPAADVWSAIKELEKKTPYLLWPKRTKVNDVSSIKVYGTPRRLVVYIENLEMEDSFDSTSFGEIVPSLIRFLTFEKSMRWIPNSKISFSRPIRWLVAMLDDQLIEAEYAGVRSSTTSYGPRFLSSPPIKISSVEEYFEQLEKHHIVLDQNKRREMIVRQNKKLADEVKGFMPEDTELLNEVVQLVEYPTCIRSKFDRRYLGIPREVATTVMREHQRYFSIVDKNGDLLPYFITVANQLEDNVDLIRQGNEKVVEARLNDGQFFYQQDRKHKLEHFLPQLKTITFHEKLGSVYEKTERLEKMVPYLAEIFKLTKQTQSALERAAHLCKADLATSLVKEFPSLEGVIGRVYAEEDNEGKHVAEAIYEHYLPRFRGDKLPQSAMGQILAVADRIDTLAGFFAVGLQPSGSQDPYALRRATLSLVQILVEMKAFLKLSQLIKLANQFLPVDLNKKELNKLITFVQEKVKADLKERGLRDDIIKAILVGPRSEDVFFTYQLAQELSRLIHNKQFKEFIQAAKRVQNIIRKREVAGEINTNLFKKRAEKNLFDNYLIIQACVEKAVEKNNISSVINEYQKLTKHINAFFDDVLVMTKDKKIRKNRLRMLNKINLLFRVLFDPTGLVV